MAPLAAEALLFFACAKKSRQKKHPPAGRPPQAAGAQSRREFSNGASCPGRKRRTSLCAALRVLPAGTAGPKGPQKPARTDPACTPLPWLFGVPMRHGEWAGQNLKGAVMDDGVFVWHRDVPYENSRPARGPGAKRRACRLGRVSLVPFFARAKRCFSTAEWLVKGRPRGERHHGSETETSLARPPKVGAITDVVTARTNTRTWLDLSPAPLSHRDFLRAPQEEGLDRVPLKPG